MKIKIKKISIDFNVKIFYQIEITRIHKSIQILVLITLLIINLIMNDKNFNNFHNGVNDLT